MVRRAITVLSPLAALMVIWVSVQSLNAGEEAGGGHPPAPASNTIASTTETAMLPELTSVSRILDSDARPLDSAAAAQVPDSIRRVLTDRGAVLLVPETGEDQ